MVPWLGLVAMVFEIWSRYDQLPARIASHFNAAGLPNGWAPKNEFFTVIVPMSVVFLALFTFLASRFESNSGLGWVTLIAEYWGTGLFAGLTHATLRFAMGETTTLNFPFAFWNVVCLVALVVGEVVRISGLRQRADATNGRLIAQESHSSPKLGSAFLIISLCACAAAVGTGARGTVLAVLAPIALILVGCAAWVFTGFVYRITTAGLEIRTFGLPIRFIPAADIEWVRAQSCNPLTDFGGWGIRGIGKMRAYIWGGRRCVHIHTHGGDDIYLGTAHPDRMVRELEMVESVPRA